MFANVSTIVVKSILFLQICKATLLNLPICPKTSLNGHYVGQHAKRGRSIDIMFASMSKDAVKLSLVVHICQKISLNGHDVCQHVKRRH